MDTETPDDAIRRVMSLLGRRSAAATRERMTPAEVRARMSELGKRGGRAGKGIKRPRRNKIPLA